MPCPWGMGAATFFQVNAGGLQSALCFRHLSAGELEHPFHLTVFIQRTKVNAFSRLGGNMSFCVQVKAINTINHLYQQQCLKTSILFLCSSDGPLASPGAHR